MSGSADAGPLVVKARFIIFRMRELFAGLWRSAKLLPLLALSTFFLAGVALASLIMLDPILWGALAFLALAAWGLWRGSALRCLGLPMGDVALAALLLAAALAGAARYQLTQAPPTPEDIAYYNNSGRVTVVGRIVRPVLVHDSYVEAVIQAERLEPVGGEHKALDGLVLAQLSLADNWQYGDRLRLSGTLETPPGGDDFDYRLYLARYGIHAQLNFPDTFLIQHDAGNPLLAALFGIRQHGVDLLYRLYPAPEAALLSGILLGDETGLSAGQKQAYNDSGLRHIIAISGFNITIIAGLLFRLFSRWWGRGRGALLAALGIGLYTILVGGDAAVMRAALMGGLALYARQLGRRQEGLTSLALTGALMALVNPLLLWDVGFQLSFAATLGIILYADSLQTRFDRWLQPRVPETRRSALSAAAGEYLLITLAAQITTLPLLLYHFQRLSLVSFPANLLVLPVQPALMVMGGLSLMLGLVLAPVGRLLSLGAWPLAAFSNRMADWFAGLPGAANPVAPFGLGWLIAFYVLLFTATFAWDWLRPRLPRAQPALALTGMAALSLWLWSAVAATPDGHLTVTLLDLPDGEALLVQTPTGRTMLINGGSSAIELQQQIARHLPPYHRDLDWLLVGGVRQEQLAGLVNSLEALEPASIAWSGDTAASFAARQLHERMLAADVTYQVLQSGQMFDLGDGATMQVLATGGRGALLLITYGDFRMLLPLGVDFEVMQALDDGRAIGPVNVLLLADNGYVPLNPPEWIANLDPDFIWVPVGRDPPNAELWALIGTRSTLRTDQNGWGRLSTDGARLWIESEG